MMPDRVTVLLADIDDKWLWHTEENLTSQMGYNVIRANTFGEAEKLLTKGEFDIAIIEIRMVDYNDEKDISGLFLAKQFAKNKPVIITAPGIRFDDIRDWLRGINGLPANIDFIDKAEKPFEKVILLP